MGAARQTCRAAPVQKGLQRFGGEHHYVACNLFLGGAFDGAVPVPAAHRAHRP